jgi:hypothetical protein
VQFPIRPILLPARCMRRISLLCSGLILLITVVAQSQVLPANEIKDPELRALQERDMDSLKQLGADILALPTDYPFYLSRKLDLDQAKQKWADQRSIQFNRYQGKIVLQITGNYYAAYSAEKMNSDQRARETFLRVCEPILKASVKHFQNNASVQAYALEISHHVLGKIGGVTAERAENLVIILPQAAATRLVNSDDDRARQAALMQGQIFVNAKAATIWLNGEILELAEQNAPGDPSAQSTTSSSKDLLHGGVPDSEKVPSPVRGPELQPVKPSEAAAPPRDTSPESLATIQSSYQKIIDGLLKDLNPQAHFVSYQPAAIIAFRKQAYLEFSITTSLPASSAGSRYKMAALAFDEHIAHLLRPVTSYFKGNPEFDGIGFSTTIHLEGKTAAAQTSSEAVEFFFPTVALRCYETYDCTGQQLIDQAAVLINGERVSLDLQVAEAGVQ